MASKAYLEKLESVNGIGAKTAQKIAAALSTEAQMVSALTSDGELPDVLDGHVDGLREIFIGEDESSAEPEVVKTSEDAPVSDDLPPEIDSTPITEKSQPVPKTPETPTAKKNFLDPDFDWTVDTNWKDDPEAVRHWLTFYS